jgi:flavin reductase (DIM6/NTAB) family NADH-FMN oxidoreductase RutF
MAEDDATGAVGNLDGKLRGQLLDLAAAALGDLAGNALLRAGSLVLCRRLGRAILARLAVRLDRQRRSDRENRDQQGHQQMSETKAHWATIYHTGATVQTAANRTHGKLTAPAGQIQCPVAIDILRTRPTACAATVWLGKGWWEAPRKSDREGTMTRSSRKSSFPVSRVRQYLEPGPIVLVSSRWRDETDIMTMGWHTVMEFTPSLVGCIISSANHSFELIRQSGQCVINVPAIELIDKVVGIGNSTGADIDKFAHFGLTPQKARKVKAPLVKECFANFECRLHDDALVDTYDFFIFEIVAAHVAASPKNPRTLHYQGDGSFMVSGKIISRRSKFQPGML